MKALNHEGSGQGDESEKSAIYFLSPTDSAIF